MMQWIIGLVVAAVVVVGGGYYAMSGGYTMSDEAPTIAVGEPSPEGDTAAKEYDKATPKLAEKAAAFTGSFFDLGARGGNYVCTVSSAGATADTKGTVYVSGTNLRGDFNTVSSGTAIESHMLKIDDDMFMWSSAMTQGIMMKATEVKSNSKGAMQGGGVSGTQEYGWDCTATGVDASKFVKPTNVEFVDLGAMMGGAAGGSMPGAGMMPKTSAY